MGKGIIIREQHFPGRAPVDAYGNGGFRFADMSHRGSILCLPSGIYGWPVEEGMPIDAATLEKVFADAAEIEHNPRAASVRLRAVERVRADRGVA